MKKCLCLLAILLLVIGMLFVSCNLGNELENTSDEISIGDDVVTEGEISTDNGETTAGDVTADDETTTDDETITEPSATTEVPDQPHEHAFGEWTTVKAATCTANGEQERTCACGDKETQGIDALGHTEVVDASVEPTCSEQGLTEGKHCAVCNEILIAQNIVDASHKWGEALNKDEESHWSCCTVCGEIGEKKDHIVGADGYCNVCELPIHESDGVYYLVSWDNTYAEVIDYVGESNRVIIAESYCGIPVTVIANEAFKNKAISIVHLPDTITKIEKSAFAGCTNLVELNIPDSVKTIEPSAFDGCTSLLQIENGVSYVANCVIGFDDSVAAVTLRDGTKNILPYAFEYCNKLKSISIPNSVVSIGESAFYESTNLSYVAIDNGVTSIGESAFAGCISLTDITIPDSVTSIGAYAFRGCNSLTSITLPFVGENKDGTGDTSIGYIFNGTDWSIEVSFARIPASLKTVVITGGSSIPVGAFAGCRNLTSIVILDGVTSVGDYAFLRCYNLTSITLPDGVTSIGDYAFSNCTFLPSITLPDGVISIGECAFYCCDDLTSITLPDSVTSINVRAFSGCTGLTSITIPDSVTSVGAFAFSGCTGLTDVYFTGTKYQWAEISEDAEVPRSATIHYNYVPEE